MYTAELRFGYCDSSEYRVIADAFGDTREEAVTNLKRTAQQYPSISEIKERYDLFFDQRLLSENKFDFEKFWHNLITLSTVTDYDSVVTYEGESPDCPQYDEELDYERDRDFVGLETYWLK